MGGAQARTSTKQFTWSTAGLLPLLLDDGDHSYIYGPSSTPIAQVSDTSDAIEYLHADALGTPRAITNSAGAVTGTQSFDAYGTQTALTGAASTVFGFTGNLTDAITGLLYLRARDYDPATGQFLTVDPALDSTHQPYAYAGNDPVLNTDPTGMCPVNGGDFVADCTPEDFGGNSWLLSPAATVLGDIFRSCSVMNVSSLFAGITDTITFGGTRLLREALAPGWSERYGSNGFYFVGAAWGIVATGGSGLIKGLSQIRLARALFSLRVPAPLAPLAGSLARSFEGGEYTSRVLEAGTLLYRAGNVGDAVGSFFGFVRPSTRVWAEAMYNLRIWGNAAEELSTFRVIRDVTVYVGPVGGGIGEQVMFPAGMKALDFITEVARGALK